MILNDYWRKLRETNAKSLIFFPTSTNNLTTINNKTSSLSSPPIPKIPRPKSVTPPSVTTTAATTTTHTTVNSIISNPMVTQTPPPHQLALQPPSQPPPPPPPPPPPQPVTYTPTTPAPTPTPTGIYDTTTTYSRAPSRPAIFYNNRHYHHHPLQQPRSLHVPHLHHAPAAAPPFIPAHQIVRLNHPISQQHQLTPQRQFHFINKQQQPLRSQPAQINRMGVRSACNNSSRVQLNHPLTIVKTTPNRYHPHHTTISSLSSSSHPSNTNPQFMVRAQTTMMNQRQYTSATLNKLMSTPQPNNHHQQQQQQHAHYEPYLGDDIVGGGGDDDNEDDDPTTSADPEFYEGLHHSGRAGSAHGPPNLADDIYDFSMLKPSLRLESSSNNPTDDEDEGTCF